MSAALANVATIATTPISEEAPTGTSARLEPDFDTLRALIEKGYVEGAASVDWKKVIELSGSILEKKSKDLLVGSYLCCALLYVDGYAGLAEGLDALHQLMTLHWERIFPERPKARIASVAWLGEKVGAAVAKKPGKAGDREPLQTCVDKVAEIDAFLGDKLGGDAPSLREFSSALEEVLGGIAGPPSTSPAQADAGAAPSSGGAPIVIAADDFSTPEGIEAAVTRASSTLLEAARALRRSAPQDPNGYRLARFALFQQVKAAPDNTDGATMVPPPDITGITERYDSLLSGGQHTDLIEEAESQFEQMVLWLDPHRYVNLALQELGGDYDDARAAVREQTAAFLRRMPGFQELKFSDGSPYASDATKAWLQAEVLAGGGAEPVSFGGGPQIGGDQDEAFKEVLVTAKALAKRRKLADALSTLWAAADSASSRRQRYVRRLQIARFLAEGREPRLASAVLDGLEADAARFSLDEWEPTLAREAARLGLQCQRAIFRGEYEMPPEAARREEDLFTKLARLDAATALRLQRR